MTAPGHDSAARARRLISWYPRSWRARYGDEFCALLECELDERPRSLRRALNIAWSGTLARATRAGIAGMPGGTPTQARSSLAWLAASLAAFLTVGLAVWSQLVVGWQWSSPRTAGTTLGIIAMSGAVLALAVLGACAVAPIVAIVAVRIVRGTRRRRLVVPAGVAALATTVLIVGARRFENGWPGTGGHHWAHQGLVPGGVAAFLWAATLAITSYWAHPGALQSFPAPEVVWMAVSPVAMAALAVAASVTLRRVELPARLARFEFRVGQLASVAMAAFLLGSIGWLSDSSPRPRSIPSNLFHVGAIDIAAAVVMALALVCAHQAVARGIGATTRRSA
ncbi:MAG TPA: hypothetical protein VMQ40_06530 [Acidimicrobiales bacterium]|nr:hypothetical protein [Acidimicrobiales bacterium]